MSWATIYLRRQLPAASSNRPEGQTVRTEPSLCLVLLPVGFTWPARLHEPPVRSYRTISPLTPEARTTETVDEPHLKGEPLGQFTFCCTCPILADGGSYPPPCPMEPGLSSLAASHQRDRLVHFSQDNSTAVLARSELRHSCELAYRRLRQPDTPARLAPAVWYCADFLIT